MASKEARERKLKEIQEIAGDWGRMIAREAFPDGPGLDVTLADMEEYAVAASRALVKGAVESMTTTQGEQLGKEAPCPTCGKMCALKRKSRPVVVRGGEATLDEPVSHCPACRRDFFPSASGIEVGRSRVQSDDLPSHPPHRRRHQRFRRGGDGIEGRGGDFDFCAADQQLGQRGRSGDGRGS